MAAAKQAKIRVLLVDEHPLIRQGLSSLIKDESNLMVCGEAGNGGQVLDLIAATKPNLAIVGISQDARVGIEIIREVRAAYPRVLLLMLSMHDESIYAERALRAGASGYVMKTETGRTIMAAIRHVLSGKIYISEQVNDQLLHRVQPLRKGARNSASPFELLSEREDQIFRLLGDGTRVREIATRLYLSVSTIETHRVNIKRKLGVANSAELLRCAIKFSRIER